MRPSFRRVRSWVSSIERPIESTLSLTSPTLVRTNFLVAHAVVPPIASTEIEVATKNFRNMFDPPNDDLNRARLPRHVATPGAHDEVLLPGSDHERMPARCSARFESDEVL